MGNQELRIAIVGGGIGGLTAAIALQRKGVDVTVFEQAPELSEVGAGVLITPNGLRSLEALGIGATVAAQGALVGEGSRYYRMDGSLIAPVQTTDSSGWNGMYGMHRADLLSVLTEALPGGVVRTDHRCVKFEQDAHGTRLTFANGSTAEAEVVIGADGLHSTLRSYVTESSVPTFSGSVAYRGLIPADDVPDWPKNISQLWMGDGKHFLVYPARQGSLINYVGFVPSERETLESWSAPGTGQSLKKAFRGWDPRVEELLSKVNDTFWWGLYDREPLTSWTDRRLGLLGDAAHPMLPHLGQGANQAIEDGLVLAEMMACVDQIGVEGAVSAYAQLRRERTAEVQLGARANGRRYDSAYEDLGERDAEIVRSAQFRLWLYDYDPVAEARGFLSRTQADEASVGEIG